MKHKDSGFDDYRTEQAGNSGGSLLRGGIPHFTCALYSRKSLGGLPGLDLVPKCPQVLRAQSQGLLSSAHFCSGGGSWHFNGLLSHYHIPCYILNETDLHNVNNDSASFVFLTLPNLLEQRRNERET